MKNVFDVLVANIKGGVGKSLISWNLAKMFDCELVDIDAQGTLLNDDFTNKDVRIIDSPGVLQDNLSKYINAADMVIIPTKTSIFDIQATEKMIEIASQFKDKPILYVLNCFHPHYLADQRFYQYFIDNHSDLQYLIMPESTAFNQAASYNQSIVEYMPNCYAAEKMRELYDKVKEGIS